MTRLACQIAIPHPVGSSPARRRRATQAVVMRAVSVLAFLPAAVLAKQALAPPATTGAHVGALVRGYAFEAFPRWAIEHHEERCPASIDELSPYLSRAHALDAWGTALALDCGEGIRGAVIRSAGPDRRFGTADDVTSNDG